VRLKYDVLVGATRSNAQTDDHVRGARRFPRRLIKLERCLGAFVEAAMDFGEINLAVSRGLILVVDTRGEYGNTRPC